MLTNTAPDFLPARPCCTTALLDFLQSTPTFPISSTTHRPYLKSLQFVQYRLGGHTLPSSSGARVSDQTLQLELKAV